MTIVPILRFSKPWQSIGVRILRWTMLAGIVALLFLLIPAFPIYSTTNYTCVHCRADKHVQRFLGIPRVAVEDTVFSPWFRSHYSMHEHVWVWSGGTKFYSVNGSVGFSCGRRHPIYYVSPAAELALAERDPEEFRAFYRAIISSDKAEQERAVEAAELRAIELQ